MDRIKWSVALASGFIICAWVHLLLNNHNDAMAYALIGIAVAVLSLHDK